MLSVEDLSKRYRAGNRSVAALDQVSLTIDAGETLGLAGISGSGKSTLARVLLRLMPSDGGDVRFDGEDWLSLQGKALRHRRAKMQMVFQDVLGAFNPRATVGSALADPLRIHVRQSQSERRREVAELLDRVRLPAALATRPIRDVSGGQRQRIAIARALFTNPRILILDEATSALDYESEAIVQRNMAQICKGRTVLIIAHRLSAVRHAHRIVVMDKGRIVEAGAHDVLIAKPKGLYAHLWQMQGGAVAGVGAIA